MKKLVLALILTLGVAMLTGCYGESTSVTITQSGSGTMEFTFMFESYIYQVEGGDKAFKDFTDAGFTKSVTTTDNDVNYICMTKSVSFANPSELQSILTSDKKFGKKFFGSSTSDYSIALFNSAYVTADTFQAAYAGALDSTYAELIDDEDFSEYSENLDNIGIIAKMSITFDNEIVNTNGTLSDDKKSVSWNMSTTLNDTILQATTVGTSAYPTDKTKPVVEGVKNNAYYGYDDYYVDYYLSDDVGIKSATLNGKKVANDGYVYEPGKYKLVVKDFAGNTTTVTFIIDYSAPTVSGVKNGSYYNTSKTITFKDNRAVKSATLNGKTIKSGTKVSTPGKYTLKVTDKAGNVKKVTFTIDKSKPVVSGVTNGSTYTTYRTINFADNRAVETATLNGKTIKSGKVVAAPGSYTLKVTDKAGNTTTVKFTIKK